MTAEFSVSQVVPTGGPQLFVLKVNGAVDGDLDARCQDIWARLWIRAGVLTWPPLLILPLGFDLEAVTGARLAEIGLMRVPVEAST